MEKISNYLKGEWGDKKFKRYVIFNLFIMIALVCEFILFKYDILKIIRYVVLLEGIVVIAWIDIKTKKIPNRILITLLGIRVVLIVLEMIRFSEYAMVILMSSLLGMLIGFVMFIIPYFITRGGIGMGDVKMFAVIGCYVGSAVVMPSALFTVLSSAIYSGVQLIRRKTQLKDEIALGPFILIGIIITMGLGF